SFTGSIFLKQTDTYRINERTVFIMMDFQTIASKFQVKGTFIFGEPFGCGHINDTYVLYFKRELEHPLRYIVQRINHEIFKDVPALMKNIDAVTSFLAKKVTEAGGD